ncbi:MAG TPA: response regulator [Phycisphaerae bacterium]|jgi:two-component system chemotaxis response regulator CheY|nr:response regulator [Phycisphaerae bacterium]
MPAPFNILIVDDSATTRAMIKRTIMMTGFPVKAVREAPDGSAAIALLERHVGADAIDLIFTDLNMPEMNGAEFTMHVRSTAAFNLIPIVVVTAQPDDLYLVPVLRSQVQGWLCKPFTPEAVRHMMEEILHIQTA